MRRKIAAAVAVLTLPIVVAVPVAASASRSSVVSALPPSVITDISYAPAEPAGSRGHLLDLYLPPAGRAPRPLVIWTGGSAWLGDNGKDSAAEIAEVFTAKGYAVAGVSIRSSFQAKFPAQVYDIKAAIRWLRAHAGQYRLDPKRFAIMGDSSGGWTTAMAALTGGVPSLEGNVGVTGVSSQVQAAVAFYPPTEFLRMDQQMLPGACAFFNQILGLTDCHNDVLSPESRLVGCAIQTCPQAVGQASPLTYVDRRDTPMLILHGQADPLVPPGQSALLFDTIRARCGIAEYFSVPNAGHNWREILDPANHGSHTVSRTFGCRQWTNVGTPAPSWDTIERFVRLSLLLAAHR